MKKLSMTCRWVSSDFPFDSKWEIVKNPHGFPIHAFVKMNGIWGNSLSEWGVSWLDVDGTNHKDGTRTIKATREDWEKVL